MKSKYNLGDIFKNAVDKYIIPTPQEEEQQEIGRKERKMLMPPDNSERTRKIITQPLDSEKQRKVALQCPLFMKGVRKKGMDSVRAWCDFKPIFGDNSIKKKDLKLIRQFEAKVQIKKKFFKMFEASRVYGDGFILITFTNDDNTPIYLPPKENAAPFKLDVLNAEYIDKYEYLPEDNNIKQLAAYFRQKQILHLHYVDKEKNIDNWIHPSRILHLSCDPLQNSYFGNSKVNQLRNILLSKINIDIAAGEILSWFAHGFLDVKIDNPQNDDEVKKYESVAKSHPGYWIHGDEMELGIENPEAINPKPYYDYIVMNIAACLVMPTHVLTGIQTGRTTGSEIGFSDYYRDIHDIQEMDYSPLLNQLYSMLFKANGRKWDYQPSWNTIYVDELGEAEIIFKRAETVDKLRNGTAGPILNTKEARKMMNDGELTLSDELDLSGEPKKPDSIKPPMPPKKGDKDVPDNSDGAGQGNKTE